MSWPLSQDYNEAIQDPRNSFGDDELKTGEAVANALGIPMPRSGNFADVYEVRCPSGSRWAVKCFTREVAGLRERYQEVSRYLEQTPLPFTVDFTFLDRGIRLRGRWYPILKMQWVEGLTLNEFVRQYADKPDKLEALLQIWVRMSGCLRSAGIAHGDLQHGNLLLVPGSKVNSLAAKLIDYDGMFVPALAGRTSGEVGHPCYQHPQRMRERVYGREVDRFPFLLIATSLCCLQAGGRPLWDKYDSGDNLLFREADLLTPVKSPLFYQLLKQGDARSRRLVERTLEALRGELSRTPLLDDVPELQAPTAIQSAAKAAAATQVLRVASASPTRTEQPIVRRSRRRRKRSRLGVVVVAGLALLALVGVSVFLSIDLRSALSLDDDSPPTVARHDPTPPHPAEDMKVVPPPKREPLKRDKPDPPQDEKPPLLSDKPPDNPLRLATEAPTPRELFACKFRHQGAVRAVSVSANGKRALSLGAEGDVHLWDLTDGKWLGGVQSPKGDTLLCAALTPDGKQAVAGGKAKLVYLLDIEKKTIMRVFKGHTAAVNSIALSPGGTQALSGGDDKRIRRWNVAEGTTIDQWPGHEKAIDRIRFSRDGKLALTSSVDGVIRVWHARAGKQLFVTTPPSGAPPPSAVTLSPKGEHIVLGLRDGSLLVLALKPKTPPIASIHGGGTVVRTVSFTPDGRYLATLRGDDKSSSAFLVFAEGAKYHRVSFGKQANSPRALAFTPDSRRVVLGCADGTVRVWEVNGSASSSHEEMTEALPLPPIKRGDPLIDHPADPLVRKPPDPPPAKPRTPRVGDTIQNSLGMKLTYIPAGKFLMGTSADEMAKYKTLPNRGYDSGSKELREETPQHEARLTKSFYLGVYEVTQSEYEKVMKKNPSEFKGASLPVDSVSWANAVMFCKKLSDLPDEKKAGRTYRLPTEAEWEYACRAGTTTAFHYGDSLSFADANFNGDFPFGDRSVVKKKGLGTTVEVGKYKANAWGLYDMHGNVWEWCLDGPRQYTGNAVVDPQGPASDRHRVLRGGCWRDGAARSAYRKIRDAANYHFNICGMRVLCEQTAR